MCSMVRLATTRDNVVELEQWNTLASLLGFVVSSLTEVGVVRVAELSSSAEADVKRQLIRLP